MDTTTTEQTINLPVMPNFNNFIDEYGIVHGEEYYKTLKAWKSVCKAILHHQSREASSLES